MTNADGEDITWHGEPAVRLQAGSYEAVILPGIGGNLVSFRNVAEDLRFIREPRAEEMAEFKERPIVYGIPVLFPPNRYDGGQFTVDGQTYSFPINEPETNTHIHGMLCRLPWEVVEQESDQSNSRVTLRHEVNAAHPMYRSFPHAFVVTLIYTLSSEGLVQQVEVKNTGSKRMPCLLGFHTAIQIPFSTHSEPSDYRVQVTIGDRWELNERSLPTGSALPLSREEIRLRDEGVYPFDEPIDHHYKAQSQHGKNQATVVDTRLGIRLTYDVGQKYTHWMLWNDGACGSFFCPEPQTCMVNAPNMTLPPEQSGVILLSPGEKWDAESRFCVDCL